MRATLMEPIDLPKQTCASTQHGGTASGLKEFGSHKGSPDLRALDSLLAMLVVYASEVFEGNADAFDRDTSIFENMAAAGKRFLAQRKIGGVSIVGREKKDGHEIQKRICHMALHLRWIRGASYLARVFVVARWFPNCCADASERLPERSTFYLPYRNVVGRNAIRAVGCEYRGPVREAMD
jgi:hypothetical protein